MVELLPLLALQQDKSPALHFSSCDRCKGRRQATLESTGSTNSIAVVRISKIFCVGDGFSLMAAASDTLQTNPNSLCDFPVEHPDICKTRGFRLL